MAIFKDWAESKWAILRGTLIGFLLGILPGGTAFLSSFVSYAVKKRISKHPEKFGKGAIEGVAGPESANNAATGGSLIPLLSLGIPPNAVMALLFSSLLIHGIQPGPLLMKNHPDIFWGLVASMYLGNVLLLVLNLPLIGIWVQVLKVPYRILFPLILLFCLIGAYSVNSSTLDLFVMLLFGTLGYLMRKFDYEGAPLILAFVLGPILEQALRQSLLISKGSFMIFITRPISGITLGVAFLLLVSAIVPYVKKRRRELQRWRDRGRTKSLAPGFSLTSHFKESERRPIPNMDPRSEILTESISTDELERRWKSVREKMKEEGIDFLVMQNDNEWVGGYVRWFTDIPGRNASPFTVLFPVDDEMTTITQGGAASGKSPGRFRPAGMDDEGCQEEAYCALLPEFDLYDPL